MAWKRRQEVSGPSDLEGRALWDSPQWVVPFPVVETVLTNKQDIGDLAHGAPENITRWTPWGLEAAEPLANGAENQPSGHNLLGTANFFASDPSRGPGSCSAGCYMSTDWTHMVMGGQPGTVIQGHQTFWGPYQPKPSLDFYPSTIYQPFPSFGSVARKVP